MDLTDYERSLIDSSLIIGMKENDRNGLKASEDLTRNYYRDTTLRLFELSTKIKSLHMVKYGDLSLRDLKLIKNCLSLLDDFTYENSLEERESEVLRK